MEQFVAAVGWFFIVSFLGASPDTDLGPGAVDRDPLPVYYDAQVISFVK